MIFPDRLLITTKKSLFSCMSWGSDPRFLKRVKQRLLQSVENSVENLFNKTQSPDGRTLRGSKAFNPGRAIKTKSCFALKVIANVLEKSWELSCPFSYYLKKNYSFFSMSRVSRTNLKSSEIHVRVKNLQSCLHIYPLPTK